MRRIQFNIRTTTEQLARLKKIAAHQRTSGAAVLKNYIESEYKKIEPQLT